MSIITPNHSAINELADVLDDVNTDYCSYLKCNDDEDDIDFLVELLNEKSANCELNMKWEAFDDTRKSPNEWMSAMAYTYKSNNTKYITVTLWTANLENSWGPETFKKYVLRLLGHETIHFGQYDRIGYPKIHGLLSGHQKGLQLTAETGDADDWLRAYLGDPHELMAYGHDLAHEIQDTEDPEKTLRNPGQFLEELPVYDRYLSVFEHNSKPLKKLLSYAARYFTDV